MSIDFIEFLQGVFALAEVLQTLTPLIRSSFIASRFFPTNPMLTTLF
jgi:hypothetical protein